MRKEVMGVLLCAKNKADEFIDAKNKKRDEVLNNLMAVMGSAQEKADEFITKSNKAEEAMDGKTILVKAMKEAKETAELYIKENLQTKDQEERITELLQCAKNKAEEFIKNEEEKIMVEVVSCVRTEQEKEEEVLTVKEFSKNAGEVIQLLMDGRSRTEAKVKAEEFINGATKFINEEKKKKQTKEEEKITNLLESSMKKADEFVKNEQKMAVEPSWRTKAVEEEKSVLAAAKEFSKQAGEAIKLVNEEDQKLRDLTEWNLIANKDELLMIRSREHADDKMWAVIQGVWVEMLCFSAGRCRGYLHAKSLGNGGEYLSYVWLLLSYMGMETMPERMQRPEPPTVGDTGDLVKTPTDEDEMEEEPAQVIRRRRTAVTPTPQPRPDAGTAQEQQHPVVTPMPAISVTAVVPVGDDIV
jgi:hypothetical protein